MRVLHVTAYPPNGLGGLEIYVRQLTRYEKKMGIDCEVLSTNLNDRRTFTKYFKGVKIHFIKNHGSLWGKNPLFNIIPFFRKNHGKYDIIHVHSYIHFSTIQAVLLARLYKIPVILTFHGGVQTPYRRGGNFWEKFQIFFKKFVFDKLIGKMVVDLSNVLVSVSKSDLKSISRVFLSRRKRHNYWITNAVGDPFFIESSTRSRKYITFIGRLTTIKGFDLFLKIAEKVNQKKPNIPILIIGNGELQYLISEHASLNITYKTGVKYSEILDHYLQTKVFVLSSRFEGLPTTVLEAMASKTPVVATNVGGVPDLIQDETNGFLYEPDSVDKAVSQILTYLENPEITETLTQNAKNLVKQKFSWDFVTRKTIQVYKEILQEVTYPPYIRRGYPTTIKFNSPTKEFEKVFSDKTILFISQWRIDDINVIPGKPFYEATQWARYFKKVIFLCFSSEEKYLYKVIDENIVVIAIPFDLSESMFTTVKRLWIHYLQLIKFIRKLIDFFHIDLIRVENLIIAGFPSYIATRMSKIPLMLWLGGFERKSFEYKYNKNGFGKVLEGIIVTFEYLLLNRADLVFTVSDELFSLAKDRGVQNIFLTPNFVDYNLFRPKRLAIEDLKGRKLRFFYPGRFSSEKGIKILLEAAKILSQSYKGKFILNLIGYGLLEPWIQDFISHNNLENEVKIVGKVPFSDMPRQYQENDVFVLPSYTEGMPATLLEAMCSGCACICTNVGMNFRIVNSGENGIMIEPGNAKILADAMKFFIEDPVKIIELGERARENVIKYTKNYFMYHRFLYFRLLQGYRGERGFPRL